MIGKLYIGLTDYPSKRAVMSKFLLYKFDLLVARSLWLKNVIISSLFGCLVSQTRTKSIPTNGYPKVGR